MGHSGYGEWETSVAIARDLPNVYLDLTSVVQALDFSQMPGGSLMPRVPVFSPHVNGLIEYMVATAGSQKIVFGSDLPWYSQHYHAGAVLFSAFRTKPATTSCTATRNACSGNISNRRVDKAACGRRPLLARHVSLRRAAIARWRPKAAAVAPIKLR